MGPSGETGVGDFLSVGSAYPLLRLIPALGAPWQPGQRAALPSDNGSERGVSPYENRSASQGHAGHPEQQLPWCLGGGAIASIVFIDDVAVTVEAAQAAGMQAHLLEDDVRTITRIAAQQRAVPALSDEPRR